MDLTGVNINLPSSPSKYDSYQRASLSQKVSFNTPMLRILVGSDEQLSDTIAVLSYIEDTKGKKKGKKWVIGLLNVLRLSHFATSEKTDILSKLGFMFPKEDEEEDWKESEDEDESG